MGKCWSISLKNLAPIFVFTWQSNGGLNQVISLFLLFFLLVGEGVAGGGGSNFKLWLCSLYWSASWKVGVACLKISSFADSEDSLLLIPAKRFFRIEGGWFEFLWIYRGVSFGLM